MEIGIETIIGTLAVVIGTSRLIPQAIKTYRVKEVEDISLLWELMGITSTTLWLIYGVMRDDIILIFGTTSVLFFYAILLVQYWLYKE